MTDFSKPASPDQPDGPGESGPPPGGYPPPPVPQQPPPPGYGQPQGGYPAAPPPQGGYPAAPPPQGGYPAAPPGGVPLPPGVELASHGRRIGAYFLSIPLVIVTLVIGYVIWGLISWGRGTSPALRVLGMKVYDPATGRVVGFGKMALRDIVGYIVQSIVGAITALVSFILFLSTEKRQSLPDMIASTVVVYDPNNVLGPH